MKNRLQWFDWKMLMMTCREWTNWRESYVTKKRCVTGHVTGGRAAIGCGRRDVITATASIGAAFFFPVFQHRRTGISQLWLMNFVSFFTARLTVYGRTMSLKWINSYNCFNVNCAGGPYKLIRFGNWRPWQSCRTRFINRNWKKKQKIIFIIFKILI